MTSSFLFMVPYDRDLYISGSLKWVTEHESYEEQVGISSSLRIESISILSTYIRAGVDYQVQCFILYFHLAGTGEFLPMGVTTNLTALEAKCHHML